MSNNNASRKKVEKAAEGDSNLSPDVKPAIRNFLLGLLACIVTIAVAIFCLTNFDNLKSGFLGASQKVNSLVPRETKQTIPKKLEDHPPVPPKDELYGDSNEAAPPIPNHERAPMRKRTRIE